MAVNDIQHLKNTEIPEWVILRFRKYVETTGGKKDFMKRFNITEAYMSILWNGKRHPPAALHEELGIRLVVQPMHYEDVLEKAE